MVMVVIVELRGMMVPFCIIGLAGTATVVIHVACVFLVVIVIVIVV